METSFEKLSLLFCQIYLITWSWNQNFVILRSWDNFLSKNAKNVQKVWHKLTFSKKLSKESRYRQSFLMKSEKSPTRLKSSYSGKFWKISKKIACEDFLQMLYKNAFRRDDSKNGYSLKTRGAFGTLSIVCDEVFLENFEFITQLFDRVLMPLN